MCASKMITVAWVTFFIISVSFVPKDVVGFTSTMLHQRKSTKAFQNHGGQRILSLRASTSSSSQSSSSSPSSSSAKGVNVTLEEEKTRDAAVPIYTIVDEMLDAALLMYPFADMRKFAREGKLSQRFLQTPISARSLGKIIQEEEDHIREAFGGELVSILSLDALETMAKRQNKKTQALLVEFQDLESNEELVYGVGIDHSRRRVTVAFRGSTTTKDFITDVSLWSKSVPNRMHKFDETQPKRFRLHAGFHHYLFGNETVSDEEYARLMEVNPDSIGLVDDEEISKFDEILHFHVIPLLNRNPGYKLYVTGHSLGGALCTLFGFRAATLENLPKPVTIVSFASPYVGNGQYRKAFKLAEQKGWLRHLRVTNQLDAVPMTPMIALPQFRPYKHVGLNLKLFKLEHAKADCEFYYPHKQSRWARIKQNSLFFNWASLKTYVRFHGCHEHSHRLDGYKNQLLDRTLEDVYQEQLSLNQKLEEEANETSVVNTFEKRKILLLQ